ncbi:MAG: four helix bundle protein, partial [Myxococcales bacterium]|nr:four helix bundle protein [Myxococcales bacterium]
RDHTAHQQSTSMAGLSRRLRRRVGMTTHTKRPCAQPFVALELALILIESLRPVVERVRKRNARLAKQIEDAASSVAANLGEGNRRHGRDRIHFFTIAAGSADETRCHLRVAKAWGWLADRDVQRPLTLLDRELAILWKLTH